MKKNVFRVLLIAVMLWAIPDSISAQDFFERHVFKGMLNDKIPIELIWYTSLNDGEWVNAGYIYYPNAKNPAPILIVGKNIKIDPKLPNYQNLEGLQFTEYQPDGSISGRFKIMYYEVEGDYTFYKGSWTNPSTGKSLPMTKMESRYQKPSWMLKMPGVLEAAKRDAWTFEHRLDGEDNGWFHTIMVDFLYKGQKQPLSFEEPLSGGFDSVMAKELKWIEESDINFDGLPDVMVYLGTSTRAQGLFKCYVWNPDTRQFYYVSAFAEIQEPTFDKKAKTITSYVRDVDGMYIDTYKWKNGKLTRISSKKETMP